MHRSLAVHVPALCLYSANQYWYYATKTSTPYIYVLGQLRVLGRKKEKKEKERKEREKKEASSPACPRVG